MIVTQSPSEISNTIDRQQAPRFSGRPQIKHTQIESAAVLVGDSGTAGGRARSDSTKPQPLVSSLAQPLAMLFILLLTTTVVTNIGFASLAADTPWPPDKHPLSRHDTDRILKTPHGRPPLVGRPRARGRTRHDTKDNLVHSPVANLSRARRNPLIDLLAENSPTTFLENASSLHAKPPKLTAEAIATSQVNRAGRLKRNLTSSSLISPLISTVATAPTMTTKTATMPANLSEYATVNYNGIIGINATDPYAIATESRKFGLPIEIQFLMCLLYGTLAFTAVTSNMTVCYIVLSNQRMRTATNYFIVNLAVGDILMALLCIPFTFPSNMIYQYWPFGLSLCVIVSYSQANSVFISAYTMVAISIDKYIAIMYPMRLRMPKNQAKVIILVIWSAALITSLPTALLSSLSPTAPDLGPAQTSASSSSNSPPITNAPQDYATTNTYQLSSLVPTSKIGSQGEHGRAISSGADVTGTPSAGPSLQGASQQHDQQSQEFEEQKKYLCQESWLIWPSGKFYYSMALMVLQFVVPLFVLVVTYTRIVIVVWGKRVPGEEDNARDARMARSKRKMIRMVIFCVIAFALTWLPFNALIVIGDMHPDIWEYQNIMYIWFITHYLAMCHTITNPLIYFWMNSRFRAGFTQAVGDMCRFMHRSFAYLVCHCLCLGCCLDCSRQKYASVELSNNRRRARWGPLASSGSIYAYNYHNNGKGAGNHQNSHPHPHPQPHPYSQSQTREQQQQQQLPHHHNHQSDRQQQQQHHYDAQTSTNGHRTTLGNSYCTTVTGSALISKTIASHVAETNTLSPSNSATIYIKTAEDRRSDDSGSVAGLQTASSTGSEPQQYRQCPRQDMPASRPSPNKNPSPVTCDNLKSSSTFELASNHLPHVRRAPARRADCRTRKLTRARHSANSASLEIGQSLANGRCDFSDRLVNAVCRNESPGQEENTDDQEDYDSSLEADFGEPLGSASRFIDEVYRAEKLQLHSLATIAQNEEGERIDGSNRNIVFVDG